MGNQFVEVKTADSLIKALERGSCRKPTAEEVSEQRISFIYGSINPKSGVTRERIKQVLAEQEGSVAT